MQEQNTSFLITIFIEMMLVLVFLGVVFFGVQLQRVDSFKQQVDYTIERQGGMTQEALNQIKAKSANDYNSFFTVKSYQTDTNNDRQITGNEGFKSSGADTTWVKGTTASDFGQPVKYTVHMRIPVPFAALFSASKTFDADFSGTATSKVRV